MATAARAPIGVAARWRKRHPSNPAPPTLASAMTAVLYRNEHHLPARQVGLAVSAASWVRWAASRTRRCARR